MLLQFIAFIVAMVGIIFELTPIAQQYAAGVITESEFLERAISIMVKYLIIFTILIIIVALVAIMAGIKLLPLRDYNILFLIAGILLIICHVSQIIGGIYSIYYIKTLTAEELMETSGTVSGIPGLSTPGYLLIIAYIILGIALYSFGGAHEEYAAAKTPGIIIIIGAILVFIVIGYFILMYGLVKAGGALMKPTQKQPPSA